jgi:hypothetical protein
LRIALNTAPRAVDDANMAPSWYVTMLDLGLQELLDDPTTPPELAGRLRARLDAIRSDRRPHDELADRG